MCPNYNIKITENMRVWIVPVPQTPTRIPVGKVIANSNRQNQNRRNKILTGFPRQEILHGVAPCALGRIYPADY